MPARYSFSKDIEAVDLGIHLPRQKTLVVADFHVGYEEYLNKTGVLVPRHQYGETIRRLTGILSGKKFKHIIINGDLKHEFGTISDTEWNQSLRILDLLDEHAKKLTLIKGNHDTILGPIAEKKGLGIVDYTVVGDTFICHGHKIPEELDDTKAKTIIIGHEHPAASITDGGRIETYKCHLKGAYRGKELIVQPSFNPVTEGTDVLREQPLSPFLTDIGDYSVYVVGDKIYEFGEVKDLQRQL